MNPLWLSALVLGAAGSAHCIGMCGPIALAVPSIGPGRGARALSTALLNGGRLTTYALLGLAFGGFGQGLRLAGLQQGVSIIAGALLLFAAFTPSLLERSAAQGQIGLWLARLRGSMARHLRRSSPEAIWASGALNGLLPCGLVYTAALGAATTGSAVDGAILMLLFGLGTVPALVAVRFGGAFLSVPWRGKLRRLSPVVVGAMGLLLILRGSRLDIPYLSPAVPMAAHAVTDCR